MSTIYKRTKHYCQQAHRQIPTHEQRKEIGQLVIQAWCSPENKLRHPIQKTTYTSEDGTQTSVLAYPKKFNPVIDSIITSYIEALPPPRVRKRIPLVKKPVYSTK